MEPCIFFIPADNKPDYDEIPEHLRKGLKAYFVTEFTEVVKHVFGTRLKPRAKKQRS